MAEVIPTYGNGPYQDVRYFPGLAGLRGIAALLVFVHHSESSRQKQGLFNLYDHTAFRNGGTAVSFFSFYRVF